MNRQPFEISQQLLRQPQMRRSGTTTQQASRQMCQLFVSCQRLLLCMGRRREGLMPPRGFQNWPGLSRFL